MNHPVRSTARRVALAGGDVLGRATSSRRALPTFLIIGSQRCGTTTLFKTLIQHPCVLGPTLRKGVHYFDLRPNESLSWYQSHFPTASRTERLERRTGTPTQVGESSPYYMWHPLGPERISRALPGVKVLMLLRDPVERAYSAHAHERARGYETEDFTASLALEDKRLEGQAEQLATGAVERSIHHQHHAYVQRGEYIDQLLRVEATLGREKMLVIDSQDFWSAPESLWPSIQSFLQLPDRPVLFERHNARSRAPMPDDVRRELNTHFEPFDERLATWWGQIPSWRR